MGAPTETLLRLCLVVGMGLGVVGIVGGCSDPDQPSTLPSDTPTPTSSSPSPSAETVEQEVEAAVRAYYAEIVSAAKSGDTTELKNLMVKSCPCYRAVRVINRNERAGEFTPDIAIDLTLVRAHDLEPRLASVEIKTVDSPYDVVTDSGEVVDRIPASRTHLDLSVIKAPDGRWLIANFFDLES